MFEAFKCSIHVVYMLLRIFMSLNMLPSIFMSFNMLSRFLTLKVSKKLQENNVRKMQTIDFNFQTITLFSEAYNVMFELLYKQCLSIVYCYDINY